MSLDIADLVGSIRRGKLEEVRSKLAEEPNVNIQVDGMSLLFIAVFKQHEGVVEYLMSRGADAHQRNEDGLETPLILARRRNDAELIRLLMMPKDKLMSGVDLGGFERALESPAVGVMAMDAVPLRASFGGRECSICFCDEDVVVEEDSRGVRLERCGHGCCAGCMREFMRTSVDAHFASSPNPVIRCFAKGCDESISFRDFERFAPRETTLKYQTRLTTAALRLMQDFSWCTKCESGGIVSSSSASSSTSSANSSANSSSSSSPSPPTSMPNCTDVHCDQCDHSYCSMCREDAHSGMTCTQKYEQVMATDSFYVERLSAKLLRQVSKPCPQCAAPTERDGGCSHMTCRLCSFAWCWLCGGPYQGRYTFNNKCPCGSG